jgi:hypothetical protein
MKCRIQHFLCAADKREKKSKQVSLSFSLFLSGIRSIQTVGAFVVASSSFCLLRLCVPTYLLPASCLLERELTFRHSFC